MLNKMLLVFLQFGPVFRILAKVDFIDCPEASHLVLVHFPDIRVLDGQNDKSVGVVLKKWLIQCDLRSANLAELRLSGNL